MKRIVLFVLTNLAVMLVLSATLRIFGVDRFLTANGLNITQLLIFSVIIGFTGSIISLLMSKSMAKWSTGAQVIDPNAPRSQREAWLLDTVHQLADRAGIGRPEVAIYDGAPNAFATGAFKNESLVAVSTGLLESMTEEEVAAVLGHEVAHIANGDMVTLTLIQGVVNTFVVFLARVVGYFIDRTILRNERGLGAGYYITVIVCEILFGIAASVIVAWFSRQREFRADAGSAHLLGSRDPMIRALARLGGLEAGELPKSFEASGISGRNAISAIFASHPPIQQRIAALQRGAA
ncbi:MULTISPECIES: protease HtpX [unclassified Achromobacter]|uniref:protease HtpX n=1 Tax=unclassified Achromobacter TaxID=2626865 RepID=UPI000B51A0FC|nr:MULTISPECIES: protease HtpX [unclassified Achromobacter]OWT70180.1 zinc metalloprotease HtpX [Achromobacter sp. HZ34]OWT71720.1 zinc metalloprotease HtpX [Achromobacter sp. HZ28]